MGLGTKEISYIGSRKKVSSRLSLSQAICDKIREDFPIYQTSPEMLDYGSSIPLALLLDETFNPKVTVINKAEGLSLEEQYRMGQKLAEALAEDGEDCAIIASADLSHRLKKSSPGGYSPKGAKFDNKLIEYLNDSEKGPAQILAMDNNLIRDAKSCGIKCIASALGTIARFRYEPEVLSYQTELGVGYLSFIFRLQ
jgi:AmmeMemoRadiSam system protein B